MKENASWLPSRRTSNQEQESTADDIPDVHIHGPRPVLLYHIAAFLEVNECGLQCLLFQSAIKRKEYDNFIHAAAVRYFIEL